MSIIYLLIVLIQITTAVPNSIEKSADYTSTMPGSTKEISDEWQSFTITAYCGCEKCCGKNDRITATGAYAIEGVTIAVDPAVIPYGSLVDIEGIGTFIAEDCGGAIKGNKIDIYFERHEDALRFGVWEDWRVRIRE
ncbi:nlpC/P60 family protein [Firmicutes bacterium CAG:882]|jgi:3D (Asp-Asp-Asp) domain-containing protein|nr:nlpC/P60 family protein [Firmicutes bacterium CAG:882]